MVLRMCTNGNRVADPAMRTLSTVSVLAGAAVLAAAITIAPASAKKNAVQEGASASETAHPDDPLMVVISLRNQKAHIYRGMSLITSTRVSSGKRGYSTKAGVYSILEKRRRHYSNLYAGAPMPYMQRMTWSGTALHAGVVPGYAASHGCVRLPHSFAPKLFSMTNVGEQVVVANGMVKPRRIEHPALFQPLPPPMPPTLVEKDQAQPKVIRKSSNDAPLAKTRFPLVLAKAEAAEPQVALVDRTESVAPFALNAEPEADRAEHSTAVARLEDTDDHAIDPNAAPFVGSDSIPLTATADTAPLGEQVPAELSDNLLKSQELLKTQELRPQELKPQERLATPARSTGTNPTETGPAVALSTASPAQPDPFASTSTAGPANDVGPQESAEPEAGPILTVSAIALSAQAPEPVSVSLAVLGLNTHPPLPPAKPSVMLTRLDAGTEAAAVEAAEPFSPEPLRILVTRRTKRDRLTDVQRMLSSLGYLKPQNFDGTFGRATVHAIKAFQKDNDMPQTGAFTDDVAKKVYAVAGKKEPPQGHLFVRQKFVGMFDTPVSFANPDKLLGTHVFTVLHFETGATKAQWTAVSLNDKESAASVLDRIEIPESVRRNISERLTPGSALIVADTAINSGSLPKGADFLVWDTSQAPKVQRASVRPKPRRKKRVATRRRPTSTYQRRYRRNPWPF